MVVEGEWSEELKFPPSGSSPAYLPAGRWVGYSVKVSRKAFGAGEKPKVAVSFKKDGVKAGYNFQLSPDVKIALAGKLEKVTLTDFIEALRTRSTAPLAKKVFGLEAVLNGNVTESLVIGGGAELAELPFILKAEVKDARRLLGPAAAGMKVAVQVNIGPSAAGWVEIVKRVGATLLRTWSYAARIPALMGKLAASGVLGAAGIVTVSIVAAFGVLAGTASYVGYISRRGRAAGLATFYGSAYAARVRGRMPPEARHYDPAVKQKQQALVDQALRDVLQDARRHVASRQILLDDPDNEAQAVQAYAGALSDKFGDVYEDPGNNALRDYVTDQAFAMLRAGQL
ncbi:MAG: hypothetical protein EDX89_21520 [Acidobacteria bacterium]|nr:MAG: hypothetical protein EDX89_21520 [Acidobacteriota bacterium]MCE7959802.1 hypothetical protein [Acidobacteria bacterium ACB2]